MKQILFYAEQEFIDCLNEFKENIWDKNMEDGKAMKLLSRYFLEEYNKFIKPKKQESLF